MYGDADDAYVPPMIYVTVLSNNSVILRRYGVDGPDEGISLRKGKGDVLLNSGDEVFLTRSIFITLKSFREQTNAAPLGPVRRAELRLIADQFKLTSRVLGIGSYAAVYVAVRPDTGRQFAGKIVRLPEDVSANKEIRDKVAREYNVLKNLSHPNIVSLEKVFRMTHSVYIFQELITGGDLMSYISMKTFPLDEPEAAMVTKQLLEAVDYLHRHNVVHRDIKPENILMTSWRKGARVVLTDFGQSRSLLDVERAARTSNVVRMQSMIGTPGYTAPSVAHPSARNSELTLNLQGGLQAHADGATSWLRLQQGD
jgi:tRNA A-37 threonylcarbamoyl transferase component Bud32